MPKKKQPPETRCEHCDNLISVNASKCTHCGESVRSYRRAKIELLLFTLAIPVNLFVGYLLAFNWGQMGVWTRPAALALFFILWYMLYSSYRAYSNRKRAINTS